MRKYVHHASGSAHHCLRASIQVHIHDKKIIEVFQKETDKGWRDKELVQVFLNLLQTRGKELIVPENRIRSLDENIFDTIVATGALHWDRPNKP